MGKRGGKRKKKQREHQQAQAHERKARQSPASLNSTESDPCGQNTQPNRFDVISLVWPIVTFLAGIVVTIVFQTIFVGGLPRAGFWVEVRKWPRTYEQCQLYVILIKNNEPIEQFNVKLPLPILIDSYFVGVSEETVIDDNYQQVWKVDEDSDGNCTVEDITQNKYINVTAAAAGTTLSIQGTSIPRTTFATATVVGRIGALSPSIGGFPRDADPSTATGQYSYLKFGQIVSKEVPITYGKWGDPLSWSKEK